MEQPWPPPGPWCLPRTEAEAEEESDLDVSPSSPRCPQLPGGGAQVRRGPFLRAEGEVQSPGSRSPPGTRSPRSLRPSSVPCSALPPHPLGPSARCPRTAIVASSHLRLRRGAGPVCLTSTSAHTFSPWIRLPHPWKTCLPQTLSWQHLDGGAAHAVTLTLCPLVRGLIRAFYSVEDSNVCAIVHP